MVVVVAVRSERWGCEGGGTWMNGGRWGRLRLRNEVEKQGSGREWAWLEEW